MRLFRLYSNIKFINIPRKKTHVSLSISTTMPPFIPDFGTQDVAQENVLQSADHAHIGINGFGRIGKLINLECLQ